MDRTLRTSEGARFKTFRLSDVPQNVREVAASKLVDEVFRHAKQDFELTLAAAAEIRAIATDPELAAERFPWACSNAPRQVPVSAWEQMMKKAGRRR